MSLLDLENDLFQDISWRISELSQIKTIPFRYKMTEANKNMLIKYSVPSIYALWEGFVVSSFHYYRREINALNIPIEKVNIKLLTHAINCQDILNLGNARKDFNVQVKFVEEIMPFISGNFEIVGSIPTESNVNFKVMNKLLILHNLKELDKKHEGNLNKLLKFRNCVAHGDNSIPVEIKDINFFTQLITDLMYEVFETITYGLKEKSYLN
jgi:hypothetical protein